MPPFAWVLAAMAAGRAPGQPAGVRLSWTAPAGCPDRESVAEDLGRLSDGSVVAAEGGSHDARAVVRRSDGGFVLDLQLRSAQGSLESRRLESVDCSTLALASALMIAAAVAPGPTADHVVPAPLAEVPEPQAHAVNPDAPAPRERSPAPPRTAARRDPTRLRHHGIVGAWAGPILSVLPAASATVGGDVAWRFSHFGLQLEGWHAFAAREDLRTDVAVRAALSGGGLRVLAVPRAGPVELPLGLGVAAGVLHGGGTGDLVAPNPTRAWWAAIVAGAGVAWPASPAGLARSRGCGLRLQADALIAVRRPGIHVEDEGATVGEFRVPPLGLRVLLGPQVRFP